jgi:diacylglycerol kinase (ATP)
MMNTVVVVNPGSAGGRTGRRWPQIAAELRRAGVEFEVRETTARGEATTIARAALAEGVGRIVACGGDGTLSEVVNAFVDAGSTSAPFPDAVLGFVPSGTSADFCRTVAIPDDPVGAAAVLARGETRRIDVGRIEYAAGTTRYFVNVADCGVGGEVVRRVNAGKHRSRGKLPYAMALMRTVPAYPPVLARVEVDGVAIEGAMVAIVVANACYFGGGLQIAPLADVADGELDVILGSLGRARSVAVFRHIKRGEHLGRPGVFALRGREIRITPLGGTAMPFDVDGEQVGGAPATVRVLPQVLTLCAPRSTTA